MFTVSGDFVDVRLNGILVGVFAKNAEGELTHPDTSTHTHVVFNEPTSDARVTAHVEQTESRSRAPSSASLPDRVLTTKSEEWRTPNELDNGTLAVVEIGNA